MSALNPLPTRMESVTQAKRWLKTTLIAELPLWLQRGDQLAGDGVVTPPPRDVNTTDKSLLADYPGIEIMPQEDDPQGVDASGIYLRHRVMVSVTVAGDDEETLATQVERYIWALRGIAFNTLVTPDPTMSGGGGPIECGRSAYTQNVPKPEGIEVPFVKGGFLEMFLPTVQ